MYPPDKLQGLNAGQLSFSIEKYSLTSLVPVVHRFNTVRIRVPRPSQSNSKIDLTVHPLWFSFLEECANALFNVIRAEKFVAIQVL